MGAAALSLPAVINASKCRNDDHVGTAVEYPIVVQGNGMDDVKKEAVNALALYFLHHNEEAGGRFAQERKMCSDTPK